MKLGLIFDMDGVLIDNHTFHFKSWEALCNKYDKPLNSEDYKENMNGRTLDKVVQFIFNEPMSPQKVREIGEEKEALYRQLYQPYIRPLAGLLSFLGEADQKGIPMAVGTSAPRENVAFTMKGLGIGHYFKAILDDRAVTHGKPDPEIYQKCAKAIAVPNEKCIVFEDALSGIKAGQAAGSKVIGLATSYKRAELQADLIIDNFEDLKMDQVLALLPE